MLSLIDQRDCRIKTIIEITNMTFEEYLTEEKDAEKYRDYLKIMTNQNTLLSLDNQTADLIYKLRVNITRIPLSNDKDESNKCFPDTIIAELYNVDH